jgi:hypothetical protein
MIAERGHFTITGRKSDYTKVPIVEHVGERAPGHTMVGEYRCSLALLAKLYLNEEKI